MERTLRRSPSTAIVMDEFGLTLQDINVVHCNSVAASIRKFLLAVYDQANSVFDGRIYASAETKKDAEPIAGPALTVFGMTAAETLYAGLSEASISDGHTGISKIEPNRIVTRRYLLCMQAFQGGNP